MLTVRCFVHLAILVGLFVSDMNGLAAAESHNSQMMEVALQSITANELGQHVDVLADDSFEGREAGSQGGRATGGYLSEAMAECKLQGAGDDGSYFQLFTGGYRNVLGLLPGRDPDLQDEVVLIGAHYDHVGYGTSRNSFGPTGAIHNGADDNASGTSGVLEVMEAFTSLPQPPKRSILFAFWDAEEKGLLGSKYWVRNPTTPLDKVVMAFNSDMIGRLSNQRLEVYGVRTAPGLRQLVSEQNMELGLYLDFMWDVKANSDHYSFFHHNIPILMFHTGLHDNYHRPSDDAHLINHEGMQVVAHLMFRVAYELAESAEVASFRNQARFESNKTRDQFTQTTAAAPPRLGVSWSAEDNLGGLLVTRVTSGSPAEIAGLLSGDRILKFGGHEVTNGDQFRSIVLASPSETEAIVERKAEPEPLQLAVNLSGTPVRIGISWAQDDATPSMVILTRVIPGSAADQAGLLVGDRIYSIDGQTFADGDEFGRLVTDERTQLSLRVERQGLVRQVALNLISFSTTLHASTPIDVAIPSATAAH